ncbi:hypothetical protein B0T22DRAFT_50898 [Podospora appendiculata]|uniref:Uncharacterized protein n=1 Tax=Podospora appendiculata TaxID=314037 RepID=A0AAE0XHW7_9PEZI|nr:hypothetical protein B0T22DRAFT_50898 [Podospora appendiculata]
MVAMKCTSPSGLLAACLVAAVTVMASSAAGVDFEGSIQHEFRMGLLAPRQASTVNLQTFTGSLGGIKASAITNSGDPKRPFGVDGDTFPDFETAATRACDNQKNECAQAANNKTGSFAVGDCDKQQVECKRVASATPASATAFPAAAPAAPATALVSSNADFDFFCE